MAGQPRRYSLQVESDSAGQRLDRFLASRLSDISRSQVQKWIEAGSVNVNGRPQRARYLVHGGDRIEIEAPPPEPAHLVPEAIPLTIVYEDEDLAVVNKPAGLVVHPGAGNRRGTLANALSYHFSEIGRSAGLRPGLVHRLDKQTSGLLVVAKNERVHELLSAQFKARQVEKIYLALVYGRLAGGKGKIEAPIGRDPLRRTRMSTRSRRPRAALTEWEVIGRPPGFTYLRIRLHTGRTHQIRVHFQHIGHPVVGDETYGRGNLRGLTDSGTAGRIQSLGRHFLHACQLTFRHPVSGDQMSFQADLPAELADLLAALE